MRKASQRFHGPILRGFVQAQVIALAYGCAGAHWLEFAKVARRAEYLAGRPRVDRQRRAGICWLSGKRSAQSNGGDAGTIGRSP